MVFVGVVLMAVALLLVLLLARMTVVEVDRFQRLTAMAILGAITIAAVLFAAGMVLIGVTVLGTL